MPLLPDIFGQHGAISRSFIKECSLSLEAQGRAPNGISWLWEHYDNGRQDHVSQGESGKQVHDYLTRLDNHEFLKFGHLGPEQPLVFWPAPK